MTTIAVNRKQMAGDKQVTHSSGIQFNAGTKLTVIEGAEGYPKKFVTGYAGDVDTAIAILDYFVAPSTWKMPKNSRNVEFIVLTDKGKIYTFIDPRKWLPVGEMFYAIGSGCHFAMGAMACGKSPREAVLVASKLDRGTGRGVAVIEF